MGICGGGVEHHKQTLLLKTPGQELSARTHLQDRRGGHLRPRWLRRRRRRAVGRPKALLRLQGLAGHGVDAVERQPAAARDAWPAIVKRR